jgi:hypothetical protein
MKLLEGQRQTRSFAEVIERVQSASKAAESQKPPKPKPVADDKAPSTDDEVSDAPESPVAATQPVAEPVAPASPDPETPTPETPAADENS